MSRPVPARRQTPPILPHAHRDQILLFGVMLTIAIGNTGLQSVLPAIGRVLRVPDTVIALAFSLSALIWVVAAPRWAARLGDHGAKRMVLTGLGGFAVSLIVCGIALTLGVRGAISAEIAFAGFIVGRAIYGFFGAAAPPAAQALIAFESSRDERTGALTLLASAFGLGTILGPALAPFFVLPFVGLAGPAYVFALLALAMIITVAALLPKVAAGAARGAPAAYPGIGGASGDAGVVAEGVGRPEGRIRTADPRIRAWMAFGLVSGHAQAIAGQVIAFLTIDRLGIGPAQAQPLIGTILMAGAGAALLAQWGVIPRLGLRPRALVLWGSGIAAAGCVAIAVARDLHMLAVAFALASLGFGFLRPGFTAGASLAVGEREQGAVAGRVTAINGFSFVLGPSAGVLLYEWWRPLPYLLCAAALAAMILYGRRALSAG